MRLSDLMKHETPSPAPPADKPAPETGRRAPDLPPQTGYHPPPFQPPVQNSPPRPQEPLPRPQPLPKPQAPLPEAQESFGYDSIPQAIYDAAEQLEIPIPQNRSITLKNAKKTLTELFNVALDSTADRSDVWPKVRDIANDLSIVIALDSNLAKVLELYSEPQDRLVAHSINAAMISMDLAKEVDGTECSDQDIGAAALLHDIGIKSLGLQLTANDETDVTTHVNEGVRILEELKVPQSIITMVAQHHYRLDDQNREAGKGNKSFLISSQVLALAESFDRIMCDSLRDGCNPNGTPSNYVQATITRYRKSFNNDILKAFISLRGFYPDGTMVELTNRSICIVIKQNEGYPLRPIVQVVVDGAGNHPDKAEIINLRNTNALSIMRAVSQNGED